MQTGMFIYCFDTFLDNKTLYLLSNIYSIKHYFDGSEYQVHHLGEIEESHVMEKVMLWTQPKATLHSEA